MLDVRIRYHGVTLLGANPVAAQEKIVRILYIVAALIIVVGLGAGVGAFIETDLVAADPAEWCSDPRPEVCTMQYAPACAVLAKGGRKEFSSPCTACSSDAVSGYDTGPCPQ